MHFDNVPWVQYNQLSCRNFVSHPRPKVAGLALIMTSVQDQDVQESRERRCGAHPGLTVLAKGPDDRRIGR